LPVIDLLAVNNRFCKAVVSEIDKQEAECRHDSDKAKIARGQQSGQYHGRDELNAHTRDAGEERGNCTSGRQTFEIACIDLTVEGSISIKRFQNCTPTGGTCWLLSHCGGAIGVCFITEVTLCDSYLAVSVMAHCMRHRGLTS
jgi:hypothetical protein